MGNDESASDCPKNAKKGKTEEHINVFYLPVYVFVLSHLSFGLYVEPF